MGKKSLLLAWVLNVVPGLGFNLCWQDVVRRFLDYYRRDIIFAALLDRHRGYSRASALSGHGIDRLHCVCDDRVV